MSSYELSPHEELLCIAESAGTGLEARDKISVAFELVRIALQEAGETGDIEWLLREAGDLNTAVMRIVVAIAEQNAQ